MQVYVIVAVNEYVEHFQTGESPALLVSCAGAFTQLVKAEHVANELNREAQQMGNFSVSYSVAHLEVK